MGCIAYCLWFRCRRRGGIDYEDTLVVCKKQRCVSPVRSAGKSPALPGPVRERTALFPQSASREADAGGDQQGLLDLTQRHGWVLRFELIRSVDHGEAQAEATRSSPIEGLEERITPDVVEWV